MSHKRAKAVGKLLFFDNKTTPRSIDRFGIILMNQIGCMQPVGRDLSRSAIYEKQIACTMDSALRRNVINHAPTPFGTR